jgi:hypothetical protein
VGLEGGPGCSPGTERRWALLPKMKGCVLGGEQAGQKKLVGPDWYYIGFGRPYVKGRLYLEGEEPHRGTEP